VHKPTAIITTTKMICSTTLFFLGAGYNVTRSYKRSGVTVVVDPPLEMHLQRWVTPSPARENELIFRDG